MSVETLPFPVQRKDLGPFERLFQTRSFSPTRIFAFITCGLGVALGAGLLKVAQELDPASDTASIAQKFVIGLFVLSFLCLLGGLLYQVKANRVALFQHGAAIEAAGKVDEFRWDELHHYFNSEIGQPFRFSLCSKSELCISNETAGFLDLCAEIRLRSGPFIFQREFAAIANTGSAAFGPLTLTRDGIRHNGKSFSWSDFRQLYSRITAGRETLTFETGWTPGTGVMVQAEKIPSFHVCRQLIEKLAPAHLLVTEA